MAGPANMLGRARSNSDVETFVERHGFAVFQAARRFSNSAVDAEDVYQRTLEILLTKAPVSADEWLPWALTVARNEALKLHRRPRSAKYVIPLDELEMVSGTVAPDDKAVENERTRERRAALARIHQKHLRCLLLQADGLSYAEIERATGHSHTQVCRYIAGGRRSLSAHLQRLESGAECLRVRPLLSALADGEATPDQRSDAKLHLSVCPQCQMLLREFRSLPRELAGLFPLAPALGQADGPLRQVLDHAGSLWASLQERLAGAGPVASPGGEMAVAKKAALVTAVAATLTAGGTQVGSIVNSPEPDRPSAHQKARVSTTGDPQLGPFVIEPGSDESAPVGRRVAAEPEGDEVVSPARIADTPPTEAPDADAVLAEPPAPVAGDPGTTDPNTPVAPSTDVDPAEQLQP